MVDDAFNEIKEKLADMIYGGNLDAKTGLDLLMTAKYFERIGDHAVNIAEWVEYSITGQHRTNAHTNIIDLKIFFVTSLHFPFLFNSSGKYH